MVVLGSVGHGPSVSMSAAPDLFASPQVQSSTCSFANSLMLAFLSDRLAFCRTRWQHLSAQRKLRNPVSENERLEGLGFEVVRGSETRICLGFSAMSCVNHSCAHPREPERLRKKR